VGSFGRRAPVGDANVRTARKQGKDVLDFMLRSVTAHLDGTTPPRLLGVSAAA
jgi:hypothetical protein